MNSSYFRNHVPVRNRFAVFRRIIIAIGVLIAVMVLIVCFFSMEDIVEGVGTVAGIREWELKTLVSARTSEIFAHDGDEVKRGARLAAFEDRDQHARITALKDQLKELELQLGVKQKSFELLQTDPLPDYYRHTKLQLEEAKERLIRNEKELKVYADLYQRHAITRREYLKVELDHLSSQMALKRLSDDWQKLSGGMAKEILSRAKEEIKLLKQTIESKKHEISLEEKRLEDYILYAPDDGVVTDIPPRPGGYYGKGETVVKFAANSSKKVLALVEESLIFKVAPGQKVRIYSNQYNYLDYGYFTGKVTDVFQLPVERGKMKYYPVRIVLDDERYPLRFGAGCEVKIVTGQDKIVCVLLGIHGEDFWTRRGLKRGDRR